MFISQLPSRSEDSVESLWLCRLLVHVSLGRLGYSRAWILSASARKSVMPCSS